VPDLRDTAGRAQSEARSTTTETQSSWPTDAGQGPAREPPASDVNPRWVAPRQASEARDDDPGHANARHGVGYATRGVSASPSSARRSPSPAPVSRSYASGASADVQALLGSLSYGRSSPGLAGRSLGESQSSPHVGGAGGVRSEHDSSRAPLSRQSRAPLYSGNGHSHRSLQTDSSASFSSVGGGGGGGATTSTAGGAALSSSDFGAVHRWPHATDAGATPRRWASTSLSSSAAVLPEGLDAIKARLDALSAPADHSPRRRVAGAASPPSDVSFAERRVRELEAERVESRAREAEQLRVVRACLSERDELRRTDDDRTQVSDPPRHALGLHLLLCRHCACRSLLCGEPHQAAHAVCANVPARILANTSLVLPPSFPAFARRRWNLFSESLWSLWSDSRKSEADGSNRLTPKQPR
jgi:hypothetical protein